MKTDGLPTTGAGDPALNYDAVQSDITKHRGKRVTWSFSPCPSDGARFMTALDMKEAIGPRHYGIYVVDFPSEKEATDAFFKPGKSITATIAGSVDQFLSVQDPNGTSQAEIPKVTVPLLVFSMRA